MTVKSEEAFKEILCLVGMLSSTRIHYWLGAQREEVRGSTHHNNEPVDKSFEDSL